MTYTEHIESVDAESARHLVAVMRDTLDKLRAAECFEKKRALLQILGFDRVENERELVLIVNALRRSAYPGRSGGIH